MDREQRVSFRQTSKQSDRCMHCKSVPAMRFADGRHPAVTVISPSILTSRLRESEAQEEGPEGPVSSGQARARLDLRPLS